MAIGFLTVFKSLRITLNVKLDRDGGIETISSSPSSGKVIVFSKEFADIRKIKVSAKYDSATVPVALYDFVDIPNPTGMTVYLFATKGGSAGNAITGEFSWEVEGVLANG